MSEIDPRRHTHMGFFQEIKGQLIRFFMDVCGIGKNIERPGPLNHLIQGVFDDPLGAPF